MGPINESPPVRRRVTALNRTLDPRLPTNLAILLVAVAAGGAAGLWELVAAGSWRAGLWAAVLAGVWAGALAVLSWALCRELDPDQPLSAFLATALALAAALAWGRPNLAAVFWLIGAMRIVSRVTGRAATAVDVLTLVAVAGWLSASDSWVFGAAMTAVLLLDGLLPPPSRRRAGWAILALAVTGAAVVAVPAVWPALAPAPPAWSAAAAALAAAGGLLFLPLLRRYRQVESVADETGGSLAPARVQAAQSVALLAGFGHALWRGPDGLVALAPLWAAVAAALLFRIVVIWRAARRPEGG